MHSYWGEEGTFSRLSHPSVCPIYMTNINEALFSPKGGGCCRKRGNRKKKPRIPLIQIAMPALKKKIIKCIQANKAGFWRGPVRQASKDGCLQRNDKNQSQSEHGRASKQLPGRSCLSWEQHQPEAADSRDHGKEVEQKVVQVLRYFFIQETGLGPLHIVTSETKAKDVASQRGSFWYMVKKEMILQMKDH